VLSSPAFAQDPSADPLAGEIWTAPTAVVAPTGTRTVRAEFAAGAEDTGAPPSSNAFATRLSFALVPVRRLELALSATSDTVDTSDRQPFDGGLTARWALPDTARVHLAVLGRVHFGGKYDAESSIRRDLGGGLGASASFCTTADCRGLVSFASTLDAHDQTVKDDFTSMGYRTLRAGLDLAAAQPITTHVGVFATGVAQLGLACSVAYGEGALSCPDTTALSATAGARLSWRTGPESRLALDVAASALRLTTPGLETHTALMAGAMLSFAWGAPAG
jgi:hypothetical protein